MTEQQLQAVELTTQTVLVDGGGKQYRKLTATEAATRADAVRGVIVRKGKAGETRFYAFYVAV